MVDVGVGHDHAVDLVGVERKVLSFLLIAPLLHATVDEDILAVHLKIMAAARDLARRPEK
jgi:hypothetical protein